MSLLRSIVVGNLPLPVAGEFDKPIRRSLNFTSTNKARPFLVRSKANQNSQPIESSTTVSRRDSMLSLAAASLSGAALLWSESAEAARVDRPKIRRKFMEKLETLKEKAGLSKPRTDDGAKEKKGPSPSLPPIDPVLPLVEAVLP